MQEIIHLVNEMSPYLLLGFFIAGLMHAFVPGRLYKQYLSNNNFKTVLNAALIGVPLPLCSCGVIPTGMSLRKEGASKASTVSFLIATPQTGVDSIAATYSLMGLPFAIVRPLAAFITALLGGQLINWFDKEVKTDVAACGTEIKMIEEQTGSLWQRFLKGMRYAFVDMIEDIGKWLVVGLAVAAMITLIVPDDFFSMFSNYPVLSILFVLLLSMPMYLCATGSIPIAVALLLKGLTPGAALVLLMAGPATNMGAMLVVNKVLGRRTFLLYMLAIVGGAVLFGLGIDYLLPREWFLSTLMQSAHCCGEEISWFASSCSFLLGVLLLNVVVRHYRRGSHGCSCHSCECVHHAHKENEKVFYVKGMSCNHCRANVERALRSLPSVEHVEVELANGKTIIFGTISDEEVRKTIEALGFTLE